MVPHVGKYNSFFRVMLVYYSLSFIEFNIILSRKLRVTLELCYRESNAEILDFMKVHNITGKFRLLESMYMNKLMGIISNLPQKKQTVGKA